MSSEIILIIIGAILVLIAIVDSITIRGASLDLIDIKIKIPLGLLGLLLIFYGAYAYGGANMPGQIEKPVLGSKRQIEYPVKSVQIISPVENDSVKCRILTYGVYPESHEKDIWVLVKPSDSLYYPQSDHTNTSHKRNGEWQVITRFGGDKGEKYDIIVYEADSNASQFFSATIQQWNEMRSFPGLELDEIPAGALEVDRISIYLLENCRGVY
ncbi:MAG: hypothetical protein EA393_01245 [Bacteroidetes bacterium]|nr:MAG: hypothetical protein EA393_01245 [Bacteroidota bacterium]